MTASDDLVGDGGRQADQVEEFAQGEIRSFHGRVDAWLVAVYTVLGVWGVYYLIRFWGGLGPGQAR